MKHHDEEADAFCRLAAQAAGRGLDAATCDLLMGHLDLVLEANKIVNLTAIRDRDEAIYLHVLDSLAAVPIVDSLPDGPIVDLGSGAGFPGIPLAISTGRPVTLVESVNKKANFLREAIVSLGLDIQVRSERAEDLARVTPEAFELVTARALSSLPSLVELASPLLRRGGHLVAYKGDLSSEELARGERAGAICGMTLVRVVQVGLPEREEHRMVPVFKKTGKPKMRLPRRIGLAQRQPLA